MTPPGSGGPQREGSLSREARSAATLPTRGVPRCAGEGLEVPVGTDLLLGRPGEQPSFYGICFMGPCHQTLTMNWGISLLNAGPCS